MIRSRKSDVFHKDSCIRANKENSIHWGFADDKTVEEVMDLTLPRKGVVQPCGVCFKKEIEEYRKRNS